MDTLVSILVLLFILLIFCHFSSRFCDAKLAESSKKACGQGYFYDSDINVCISCIFACKINKRKCRSHGCVGTLSAPNKLEVVNSTAVAATVEWISDGYSEQKFYVQYKKRALKWDVVSEVPQGGIPDPGQKKTVRYKVTGLESNVFYAFRVRSDNSHPGSHESVFSNVAYVTTPVAPKTSVTAVRIHNNVTIRWEQVIGQYTVIKVKYCILGTESCVNYIAPKPEDNFVTLVLDPDKIYYYYVIIEDSGDVVYMSNRLVVKDIGTSAVMRNTSVGLFGAVLVIGVVVTVAVQRKRRQRKKRQNRRPANEEGDTIPLMHCHASDADDNCSGSAPMRVLNPPDMTVRSRQRLSIMTQSYPSPFSPRKSERSLIARKYSL
ncbi:uncharacterized protein LOC135502645 [Lineus longissimus]|uniref:uncharacterized protein LOC135502645 n=1 Tax=Lineus longissimus TaxID=88925 RepID=UPI00315D470A